MEITLVRQNQQVVVRVDGTESHTFPFVDAFPSADERDALEKRLDPAPYCTRLFGLLFPADSAAHRQYIATSDAGDHASGDHTSGDDTPGDDTSGDHTPGDHTGLPLPGSRRHLQIISDDADLQRVPWEYLRNGDYWLALKFLLTRGLPPNQRIASAQTEISADALSVLVVVSDPFVYSDGAPVVALNVARERENLRKAFEQAHAPYRVTFVKPPTLDELHKALAERNQHTLVHFIGHGVATRDGARLAFQDRAGIAQLVTAQEFIASAGGRVFLFFLNSCETAMSLDTPVSNLAHALARAGVPYALGMQFSVPETAALRLSEFFYAFLARGNSVEESLLEARLARARDGNLARVPTKDGAIDARAFAMGIPVLYTALASPLTPRLSGEGSAVIDDFHPRVEFDTPIAPPQKFRGRVQEMATLGRLFERGYATEEEVDAAFKRDGRPPGGARVVVIRGEGGMGKSTLARRAAEHFDWRFPDGIVGLSFENLPSKDLVVNRLGKWFIGEPFDKMDEAAREGEVVDALRQRHALLVLDNYETLEEALDAGQPGALELASLIEHIAGGETVLLITSRRRVTDLATRELELDGLDENAARELFWDFAAQRRREDDESLAAQVAERVGGHPLALELLAKAFAKTEKSFPEFINGLNEQLAQARNRYKTAPRQQTLAGCFDYSFQFLPSPAQTLFPKLRLFAAPFLADAVKEIFGEPEARQTLNVLWQKSMVRALEFVEDTPLYFLHPTARWYAGVVGDALRGVPLETEYGVKYGEWYARIARGAYDSFAGKTDVGLVQLARVSVEDLKQAREFLDDKKRSEQDFLLAYLLRVFGDMKSAQELLKESEQLAEKSGDARHKSLTLNEQANVFVTRGDLDGAMKLYQQSLTVEEQLGDLRGKAVTLQQMGQILGTRGKLDDALSNYEKALAIQRQIGDLRGTGVTLHNMANVFVTRGDLDGAMQLYQQSLAIKEQLGDLQGKSATLHEMAGVFVTRGDLDGAMKLYQQSAAIDEQLGDLKGKVRTLANMAGLFERRDDLERAMQLYLNALNISKQLQEPFAIANVLAMMSSVLIKRGENEQALRGLIDSLNIFVQMQAMRDANNSARRLVEMKQTIGADAFAALWQKVTGGAEMPEWLAKG